MKPQVRVALAGAGLIVLSNAVVLAGAAYNRSGQPRAVLELSERELALPYRYGSMKEDSGLSLHLRWRANTAYAPVPIAFGADFVPWFDKKKLAELGFDVSDSPRDKHAARRYGRILPRSAYIVFEFNGPAYQAIVKKRRESLDEAKALLAKDAGNQLLAGRVKVAKKALDDAAHHRSRLIGVDAGLDEIALRRRYSDRARYLILPGQVGLAVLNNKLSGVITGVNGTVINVPLAVRQAVASRPGARRGRYTVRVAYGKRFEPWILEATVERNDSGGK